MGERLRATWQAHPWTLLRIGGTLLFLSLILAYNWSHTAGLLARYASAGFGPVAALGIEGLVAVMSFRLGLSRRAGRQERMTVAVLVSVLVVSAVANLLMGHEIAGQGNALTWETMQAVDIIQGVGWVMATALLSLVAYFAADTVANDVAGLVSAPQTTQTGADSAEDDKDDDADNGDSQQTGGVLQLVDYLKRNPRASVRKTAEELQVSKSAVEKWLAVLKQEGRVSYDKTAGWLVSETERAA